MPLDNDKFRLEARKLIREGIADRSRRMATVRALIDAYVSFNGQKPDYDIIEELTDYILREELTDSSAYKISRNEYPILSKRQIQRRTQASSEVPLSCVDDVPSDSVDVLFYNTDEIRLQSEILAEVNKYDTLNQEQQVNTYNMIDALGEGAFREAYPAISDNYGLFRGRDHVEWSLSVRRRDNFTCQKCGKRGRKNMHAHHIEAYNIAIDLRYDVSNGITLCAKCHRDFHMIYGKGNNTRAQLDEWMEGAYFEF